jgi:hypothetical protein
MDSAGISARSIDFYPFLRSNRIRAADQLSISPDRAEPKNLQKPDVIARADSNAAQISDEKSKNS